MRRSTYYFGPSSGLDINYHLNKVVECVAVKDVPNIGSIEVIREGVQRVKDDLTHEESDTQGSYQNILEPIDYVLPKLDQYVHACRDNEEPKIDKPTALIFARSLDRDVHELINSLDEQK